mmetsp:Transcript_35084/g.79353  ORF Transcript_35084/g.79353 Transcript_35084/m.79353 type:complete len:109 (+) Transcript_35084:453-779(+)
MKFLEDLEMRCLNREEAEALRNHVSLQDFLQKWELPLRAFVQLRQQEVSQSLSALLLTPSQLSEVSDLMRHGPLLTIASGDQGKGATSPGWNCGGGRQQGWQRKQTRR